MATAKTGRRQWTLEARRERSLALADEHGLGVAACRFYEVETDPWSGELLSVTVDVASSSQVYADGTPLAYQVIYEAASDSARCTCESAWWGGPCKHAGAATMYGRLAADAYSQETRAAAEQEARDHLRWQANDEALRPSL